MGGGNSSCSQRGLGGLPLQPAGPSSLNDSTTSDYVFPDTVVWDSSQVQRVVALSIIMMFTLVGNSAIVAVLGRPRGTKRRSRVNLFILNLAIGDLAVGFFTQSSEMLFEISGGWVLGAAGCKAVVYVQMVTLASTTFILTSMSYDRYVAICRPLESGSGLHRAKAMLAASWTLAFLFALPQLFIFVQVQTGVTTSGRPHLECLSVGYTSHWQRQLYFSWLTTYILVAPGLVISACYICLLRAVWVASDGDAGSLVSSSVQSKDKRPGSKESPPTLRRCTQAQPLLSRARAKTLKLTVCIITSFMLCWIPYFAVHNVRIHSHYCIKVPRALIVFAETAALLNSAVNPIFYGLFNVNIRRGICDILPWACGCRRRGCSADSSQRSRCCDASQAAGVTSCSYTVGGGSAASPTEKKTSWRCKRRKLDCCMGILKPPASTTNGTVAAAAEV